MKNVYHKKLKLLLKAYKTKRFNRNLDLQKLQSFVKYDQQDE